LEDDEERITFRALLVAAVLRDGLPHHPTVQGEGVDSLVGRQGA
jgi:hypothetical protein